VDTGWPNLFVIGVARAGTSSLASYLGQHPEIFMSAVKEPYFFSARYMRHHHIPKEDATYLALFADAGSAAWRGEASTSYFWDPVSPERIEQRCPGARFIVSLRDPVARAYSGYWHAVQHAGERRAFAAAAKEELKSLPRDHLVGSAPGYVEAGLYVANLRRWQAVVGRRLHVIMFDELVGNTRPVVRGIFELLGVDPGVADRISIGASNASSVPRNAFVARLLSSPTARRAARFVIPARWQTAVVRSVRAARIPPMDARTRVMLTEFYADERPELEELLGRNLTW
jgi:hypothetical protein